MSGLEGVLLKWPLGLLQEEAGSPSTQEIILPDYQSILQDTEYDFSLENGVLTGLEDGCLRQPGPPAPRSPSPAGAPQPSCPPYWLMFSSPQQSRMAGRYSSDVWEPDPRPRSNSLNLPPRLPFASPCGDGRGEGPDARGAPPGRDLSTAGNPLQHGARKAQKAFKPSLLDPPACLSSLPHQRRKNLRQCSLPALEVRGAPQENQGPGLSGLAVPHPSIKALRRPLVTRTSSIDRVFAASQHKAPHPKTPWVELLSALSPEERGLLRAITDRGYPLHTAFIALQKTGQLAPDQIFSYLGAYEHLCELGYDKAQVEEALEMFSNSETKAEEFLNLLNQFNEMGFQQNVIKEVLLVHGNHRERALEELMTHVA
ncbi:unnamed protein product [Gadus morhua 'NCC']